ncbi:MAG TPA: prenyltransferase [Sandaracinaceae bacterium LLY-WYZ-13_1]|nr:prenyltransferase [Sandaracinaceae bacterium LLY-WYZ-13_1]
MAERSSPVRAWLRAARPLAHANIAPPLLLGQALAYAAGAGFDPGLAAVAFGFGVLDHLAIVFANDYADREADALNGAPTPLSGGSRVLVDGSIAPARLGAAALVVAGLLLAGSAAAGLLLSRPWLPALAAAALALLQLYSFAPGRASYRGFGEILQGLGVGLVLPLVGWYVQSGSIARVPWSAFAPLVVLGFVSNILTALPDAPADAAADKASWPVRRGQARARRDAMVLLGVGLLLITQVGPTLPPVWLGVVLGPPAMAAVAALRWIRRADAERRADCLRFVTLAAGAITLVHVTWSTALFLRG